MKQDNKAKERSKRAVELLGSAIDVKINELTESNRQLKRKIFDLYTIFEISRNINSVLNYRQLVDLFLLTSVGQVGASSAALYLTRDGHENRLALAMSKGIPCENEAQCEINLEGRLATYLKAMAQPMTASELSESISGSAGIPFLSIFKNGLIIPLIIQSQLKGILAMGRKVSGVGFGHDDIEFLSILANQFVVALENARLYESEKNALKELRIAQKQLVLTERQAAIGELSAKIAHEVNNPLSIISNYLHLCSRSLGSHDEAQGHLDVAREELSRIAKIVRQLLDFHRPQKVEKIPVNIRELIDDILALLKWQLDEQKIEIELLADEDLPQIMGSPEQLKQVFLNLVINAKDFMPDGGKLHIAITGNESEAGIKFIDSGPGIPQEHLSRIFEPFFTTKQGSAGTGLGLSVCFGIVREHGGNIVAGNEAGGGARFEVTLPARSNSGGES